MAGPVKLLMPIKCITKTENPLNNIFNLSKTFSISYPQGELLSRGLSFIPTPRGRDREELMGDVHTFNRQLKPLDNFGYTQNTAHIPFHIEVHLGATFIQHRKTPTSVYQTELQISHYTHLAHTRQRELTPYTQESSKTTPM